MQRRLESSVNQLAREAAQIRQCSFLDFAALTIRFAKQNSWRRSTIGYDVDVYGHINKQSCANYHYISHIICMNYMGTYSYEKYNYILVKQSVIENFGRFERGRSVWTTCVGAAILLTIRTLPPYLGCGQLPWTLFSVVPQSIG